jgi:hypothetical protein
MISLFFVVVGGVFLVGVLVLGPSLVFVSRKRVGLLMGQSQAVCATKLAAQ